VLTQLEKKLGRIVGREYVLTGPTVRSVYECDAYTIHRFEPLAVVLPKTTEEVRDVVQLCIKHQVAFVARGAGTGLSGGATPVGSAVLISLKRMNRILEVDLANRRLRAEAGVTNLQITRAVVKDGYHYAPDPSSQHVSTLGGNIAENAGGPHTLKYGVTAEHVLSIRMVTPLGEIVEIGSSVPGAPGYDWLSVIVGSEGTMGIVTEAWVKLTPNAPCVETALAFFSETRQATQAVADIIALGVVPIALEFMDETFMRVVSEAFQLQFPDGAKAFLLMEFDGDQEKVKAELSNAVVTCKKHNALEVQSAQNGAERDRLWFARKNAVGALGRLAPSKVTHDGVVPPSKLPEMISFIQAIAKRENMTIANLSHAGDGNIHPAIPLDDRNPTEVERMERVGKEILTECVRLGGSISGEHGIGVEKRDLMALSYLPVDLEFQQQVKQIFTNRSELCNPQKVLPLEATSNERKEPR
jgi:glycolate oxidase